MKLRTLTMGGEKKKLYFKISLEVSLYLRYLHQDKGVPGKKLVKKYPKYSKSSIYHHMCMPIERNLYDKRIKN